MNDTQPQYDTPSSPPVLDPAPPRSGSRGFFDQVRAAGVRRGQDRWVAGVCSGIARRLGVDPLLIRAGLIALLLLGVGFLAYLIAWALLPDQDDSILAERAVKDGDGRGIFLLVVIGLGVLGIGPLFSSGDAWWSFLVTMALVGGIWWFVTRHRGGHPAPLSGTWSPDPLGANTPGSTPPPATAGRPEPVWAPASASPRGYDPRPADPAAVPAYAGAGQASTAYAPPKAPRAGLAGFALALGAAIVGYGLGQLAGPLGGAPVELVAIVAAAAAAGLATIMLGLLGRRSALSSLLSLILAASVLGTWGVTNAPEGGGQETWRPMADSQQTSYVWNAGQGTLDLRGITQRPDQREISAEVSLGELVIYVPAGITTRIVSRADLGSIGVDGTGHTTVRESQSGPTADAEHVFGDGEADLTVNATTHLGSIRIVAPSEPS